MNQKQKRRAIRAHIKRTYKKRTARHGSWGLTGRAFCAHQFNRLPGYKSTFYEHNTGRNLIRGALQNIKECAGFGLQIIP